MNAANIQQALALGWQLLQTGNTAGADEMVRPWIALGFKDDTAPLLGAIRLQQGRFAEAAELFERVRRLHPQQGRLAFLHGMALSGINRFAEAAAAFQAAIKQDPNATDAYLGLARAQRKLGQNDEAQNSYRKLLRLMPHNVEAYIGLSSALAEAGHAREDRRQIRDACGSHRKRVCSASDHIGKA